MKPIRLFYLVLVLMFVVGAYKKTGSELPQQAGAAPTVLELVRGSQDE